MKKIILVSNMYPDSKNPSYGAFIKDISNSLKESGMLKDEVVMFKKERPLEKIVGYAFLYLKVVRKVVSSSQDDVFYVHYISHTMIPFLVLSFFKRSCIVCHVHGSDAIPEKKLSRVLSRLNSFSLRMAKKIIVPSAYFEEKLVEMYSVESKKVYVSPSGGVECTDGVKKEIKDINADNRLHVGYFGRLTKDKGVLTFIEALKLCEYSGMIKKVTLIGSMDEEVEEEVKQACCYLSFEWNVIEAMPRDELIYQYKKLDVFVFPTLRASESLGLVGLEAMAAGVPVVASRIGGIQEYLEDGKNGYLFSPGDYEGLKESLEKYVDLGWDERLSTYECCISSAKNYDKLKVKNRLVDILNEE